jgi:hypothetical protein
MLVIAHHNIQNTEKFWATAKTLTNVLPPNLKLHSVFPSTDLKTGTCIWEAPSVHDVQKFLDDSVGNISRNFCYEVNVAAAVGLPKIAMEAANN